MRTSVLVLLVFISTIAQAQKKKKKGTDPLPTNLQVHVAFLASDKLEGRRTGTPGEKAAAEYIGAQFESIGLQPKGTDGWYQAFEVAEGMQVNPTTHLIIDESSLVLNKDFFPLSYSANASLQAMPSITLQEAGMPWFFDLKDLMEANKNNPHFDLPTAVQNKAAEVARKGGTALFVYNTSGTADGLSFNGKEGAKAVAIPVVYLTKAVADRYLADATASLDMKLKTDIGAKVRKGLNVVGYIDNGAAHTVILGAHYDHLGWGEDNNSMMRTGDKEIHNGADDNASGTAALIELGRMLKTSKAVKNNYLLIAFSGEELGLYGSKYFTEHPTINLGTVNYMINMDMVGRLNDSSKTVTVGGYGTSPLWSAAYSLSGKNALYSEGLQFRFDSSGTGPSDHTSFYRKDLPVLFYFTGLHTDYHRPTDDAERVNYAGQALIVKHIFSLIEHTDKQPGKLTFTKTREAQMSTSARFSVSMGIMPDYTFTGGGVRVDGVSEGRPAQKAGIKTGDVITAIGDHKTGSVESYMQALGKFKKGDSTTVKYQRGKESLAATVQF